MDQSADGKRKGGGLTSGGGADSSVLIGASAGEGNFPARGTVRVEVINTGTELLLGDVVNLHLQYIAQGLWPLGLRVERQTTVPDGAAIREALVEAFERSDLVFVTGGLGPTTDDMTREITAELLGCPLTENSDIIARIRDRCARRGIRYHQSMGRQAMVPRGATILSNDFGTAPGLYFPPVASLATATPHVFLLPGPPRELNPIFERCVIPMLHEAGLARPDVSSRTYRCVGIGESGVQERIGLRLTRLPNIEVGYCARPNEVEFRIIGPPALLQEVDPEVRRALGDFIFSTKAEALEHVVISALRTARLTVATAESCTGGFLANRITDVPGASEVFLRGWIVYANDAKVAELGVQKASIEAHGAVSDVVAREMALGAQVSSGADFALSSTGIAGPTGGTLEKPVGTVFLGIASKTGVLEVRRECFQTSRESFKQFASQSALAMLRTALRRLGGI